MDGNSPSRPEFEPPIGARPYLEMLRERAPTLLDEALALAHQFPEELGEDPSLFALLDVMATALPAGRAEIIVDAQPPNTPLATACLRLVSHAGFLRTRRGPRTIFWWPGERIHELAEGLYVRASRSPSPRWRTAGNAAYDLFLRVCVAIAHEFEMSPTTLE